MRYLFHGCVSDTNASHRLITEEFYTYAGLLDLVFHPLERTGEQSEKRDPGWLGYIGEYTTVPSYRDYHKPIYGSLLSNQDSMENRSFIFFSWLKWNSLLVVRPTSCSSFRDGRCLITCDVFIGCDVLLSATRDSSRPYGDSFLVLLQSIEAW